MATLLLQDGKPKARKLTGGEVVKDEAPPKIASVNGQLTPDEFAATLPILMKKVGEQFEKDMESYLFYGPGPRRP